MVRLILEDRIKKRKQLEMAKIQDVLVDFIVSLPIPAVLHGGTAIWRVYGGRRFSEDIDLYMKWDESNWLKEKLIKYMAPFNLEITKFKDTGNTLFITMKGEHANVRLEFSNQDKEGIIGNYERVDGSFVSIYVRSPEDLFSEKVNAYLSRRLVRDIYDIIFLYPLCNKEQITEIVSYLKKNLKPPKDEELLKALIIDGIVPNYKQMKETIMRW
ncbi:MAG: nucleotidyl transferase AbiEii/AbiGii toxin family protein [Candidatus Heimdallarchaeaceae archaeon]